MNVPVDYAGQLAACLNIVGSEAGVGIVEEMNHGYFEEALSNFTKDFAYGGAIRHLVDHGYTVDRIIKEFDYPISRESIEKIANQYLESKNKGQKRG